MIRLAKEEDRERLKSFLVQVFGQESEVFADQSIQACFSNDYRKPRFVIFQKDKKIVSAAAYSEQYFATGYWGISWVSVDESYRGMGHGRDIVNFCLDNIRKEITSDTSVFLAAYLNKINLYEQVGFKKIYDDPNRSFMVKKLKPL